MNKYSILEKNMKDSFGRSVKKLRISVTDRCNMRCIYCMPFNNTTWFKQDNILSYNQIIRITKIFAALGIEKIKKLKEAGIESVNISLDTFNSNKFKSMTGIEGGLDTVLDSIHLANEAGLKVKINTVV